VDEVKEIADIAKQLMLESGYHEPMVFLKGTAGKVMVQLKKLEQPMKSVSVTCLTLEQ